MSLTRTTIDAAIADRIESDPDFRSALLSDPKSALAALTGTEIPESIRITVHEESPADIHLVIAAQSALADSDLELVAGAGWGLGNSCLCSPV
jgi:hypothetical protein